MIKLMEPEVNDRVWVITPEHKKCINDICYWRKDNYMVQQNMGWRWGTFTVPAPDDLTIEQWLASYDSSVGTDLYEDFGDVYDFETQDGVWEDWEFPSNMPEEDREAFNSIYEEDGTWGLEQDGWVSVDCEINVSGPLKIEEQ